MSQASPILDYASPRKRSKFRLASRSILDVRRVEDGVEVVEYLTGQATAVAAIVFFAITGTMVGMVLSDRLVDWVTRAAIICTVIVPGVVLVPLVIQESWRRTFLRMRGDEFKLLFYGPLRSRRFVWPLEKVYSVSVQLTQSQVDAPLLGEVEVMVEGAPMIRLFTDHSQAELERVCEVLRGAMGTPPGHGGQTIHGQ